MVILDQSKSISLILKNKKLKKKKIVNYTFIIHKKGNYTSIQPILKSNSTSFMFNNICCIGRSLGAGHWSNGSSLLAIIGGR